MAFFAFVLLDPFVLQNLAEIENFHLMKMTMNHNVEHLVVAQAVLVAELQGATVAVWHLH